MNSTSGRRSERLYYSDPYCAEFTASVWAASDNWATFSRTAFHPEGGGQPSDIGTVITGKTQGDVRNVRLTAGEIWHETSVPLTPGDELRGAVDWPRRYALMRHHTVLHIANTIALKEFNAPITGVQIRPEYSRIDFDWPEFNRESASAFLGKINAIISRDLTIVASETATEGATTYGDLFRSADVRPNLDGTLRIVEIRDFDAQACSGTHVHRTSEVGECRLLKFENKGKRNKRFYFELISKNEETRQ